MGIRRILNVVPDAARRRDRIEQLIETSIALEDRMAIWQETSPPDAGEVREVRRLYVDWYTAALRELSDPDVVARFKDMYEGGTFTPRIKAFLTDPLAVNILHDPDTPNPIVDRWQNPFKGRREELGTQRDVLSAALQSESGPIQVLDELTDVFGRFPNYLALLTSSTRENIPPLAIADEADLQLVVHSILRLLYVDVRPEDPVPIMAGRSSRVDFLLHRERVMIETKMTRPSLDDKKLGEELLVDWGRYQRHPDCDAIFGLVYDPERRIRNVAALETDLSQTHSMPITRVLIVH